LSTPSREKREKASETTRQHSSQELARGWTRTTKGNNNTSVIGLETGLGKAVYSSEDRLDVLGHNTNGVANTLTTRSANTDTPLAAEVYATRYKRAMAD
jgi:hypothetical protein